MRVASSAAFVLLRWKQSKSRSGVLMFLDPDAFGEEKYINAIFNKVARQVVFGHMGWPVRLFRCDLATAGGSGSCQSPG